jgi:nucleoside-diphosphate-sugar epimerase
MVDPVEVGSIGAQLLALEDDSKHNGQRYIVSGPADITCNDIVKLVEKVIGEEVEDKEFKNTDFLTAMVNSGRFPAFGRPIEWPASNVSEIVLALKLSHLPANLY